VSNAQVFVPSTSQFYTKIASHEAVHVQQQIDGIDRDIFSVDEFWALIENLETPTREELGIAVWAHYLYYFILETDKYKKRENEREIQAHNISDPIPPRWAYQRCGRYED
jgi:hypothetical protein